MERGAMEDVTSRDNETVIRGGTVIDGTGSPGRIVDVRIRGDRIVEIGEIDAGRGQNEIDATGLVVAPGFIDIHTHYDAQVLWDADLTPSSWYGVTTVVLGSCGFGIAPIREPQHEEMLATLENVEDMPIECLKAGVTWGFETFAEYLDVIESAGTRLNVGAFVGHTPLRYFAMGSSASDRSATAEEIALMSKELRSALEAGAMGFATSVAGTHTGAYGKPVPSRLAEREEFFELADVMREVNRGCMMIAGPGGVLSFREFAMLGERSGRPTMWAALLAGNSRHGSSVQLLERHVEWGDLRPQVACRPIVAQVSLANPMVMGKLPVFQEAAATLPSERRSLYANEEWRTRART